MVGLENIKHKSKKLYLFILLPKKAKALNLIQQDWFKLAAQKDSNPALVEDHLNAFYSHFSNLLLERIVNMADLNVNFLKYFH